MTPTPARADADPAVSRLDLPAVAPPDVRPQGSPAPPASPPVVGWYSLAFLARLERVLDTLVQQRGVLGAVAVRRDGVPVSSRWPGLVGLERFAAMHAAALNALELALQPLERAPGMGVMLELGDKRVVSRAMGRDLLLVMGVAPDADWDTAFLCIEAAGLDLVEE